MPITIAGIESSSRLRIDGGPGSRIIASDPLTAPFSPACRSAVFARIG